MSSSHSSSWLLFSHLFSYPFISRRYFSASSRFDRLSAVHTLLRSLASDHARLSSLLVTHRASLDTLDATVQSLSHQLKALDSDLTEIQHSIKEKNSSLRHAENRSKLNDEERSMLQEEIRAAKWRLNRVENEKVTKMHQEQQERERQQSVKNAIQESEASISAVHNQLNTFCRYFDLITDAGRYYHGELFRLRSLHPELNPGDAAIANTRLILKQRSQIAAQVQKFISRLLVEREKQSVALEKNEETAEKRGKQEGMIQEISEKKDSLAVLLEQLEGKLQKLRVRHHELSMDNEAAKDALDAVESDLHSALSELNTARESLSANERRTEEIDELRAAQERQIIEVTLLSDAETLKLAAVEREFKDVEADRARLNDELNRLAESLGQVNSSIQVYGEQRDAKIAILNAAVKSVEEETQKIELDRRLQDARAVELFSLEVQGAQALRANENQMRNSEAAADALRNRISKSEALEKEEKEILSAVEEQRQRVETDRVGFQSTVQRLVQERFSEIEQLKDKQSEQQTATAEKQLKALMKRQELGEIERKINEFAREAEIAKEKRRKEMDRLKERLDRKREDQHRRINMETGKYERSMALFTKHQEELSVKMDKIEALKGSIQGFKGKIEANRVKRETLKGNIQARREENQRLMDRRSVMIADRLSSVERIEVEKGRHGDLMDALREAEAENAQRRAECHAAAKGLLTIHPITRTRADQQTQTLNQKERIAEALERSTYAQTKVQQDQQTDTWEDLETELQPQE